MKLLAQARRFRDDEGGFSLIELLATLTILLTVVGILTTLMVSATKSESDLTKRVQAQQEARLAVETMRRDVHCANGVTLSTTAVSLTLPSGCPSAAAMSTPHSPGGRRRPSDVGL